MEYTHYLNEEVRFISGGYELEEEGFIEIDGEKVLYAVGNALLDSSCCGNWGCRYAVVAGYTVSHKKKQDSNGNWISEVEPIKDPGIKSLITDMLKNREPVQHVQFL